MLSKNIKTLRMQKGYTQKELAEILHVTSQAVSRWEQGDVEPSIDTISSMAKFFEVTTDELIGELKDKTKEESKEEPKEEKVVEKIKPVLAVCEKCNKPIYEGNDIIRKQNVNIAGGVTVNILCSECNKKIEKEKLEEDKGYGKSQRIKSFVWSSIYTAIVLASGIYYLTTIVPTFGEIALVILLSAGIFTFSSCLYLKNNFIVNMFLGVASWGFVTFPGVIFEFSLDGFIFLIGIKILFWLLGIALGFLATVFAFCLCLPLSLFAYPFAIVKSFRNPELTESDF